MKRISARILVAMLLFLTTYAIQAQQEFREFKEIENRYEIKVNNGVYVLTVFNENIIRTAFYPDSVPVNSTSFAAVMNPEPTSITVIESISRINISTPAIEVTIRKEPFRIRYTYQNQTLLSTDKGYSATDTSRKMSLAIDDKEILYGGGERVLGMNRRGHRLEIYNRAHYGYTTRSELMNYAIPMFLSEKKYGVLFDNASHAFLDLDSQENNTVTYEALGGVMDFYVFAGKNWYDLTKNYTELTGRQPLPPRWAFGNFSSRFGYHTQQETLETADRFFKDSIPLDAIILDLYWFGPDIKGHMGNLAWDKNAFPEPEKMMDSLKSRGVKTILVTEPFILTTSKRWEEAVREGILGTDTLGFPYTYDFYFGNTGIIDVFKLSARRWFWNIYKGLDKQGVDGWWGDLGEPEVHPADLQHVNGSAEEVHNAYGHEWAGIIYEGYKKDFPDKRPFILMRAGFAGSQRYGIIPWTGDVSRSWGGLVPQPEISLQMGMQGVAYTHSDLGGFAGGDTLDGELYSRWMQYGVFQPIYRPHAQEEIPSEPVFWPEETKNKARKAIKLRYKLLPYIYNMAFENNQEGTPLMISLFYEEPKNKNLLTYDSAYLWGKSLLVSPIKQPGIEKQEIYFPKGQNWYDFYTNQPYEGGQKHTVDVVPEHIPVFAKGGSFIPMKAKAISVSEYDLRHFDMHYYADPKVRQSEYTLYNDDGKTPEAYDEGLYEIIRFKAGNKNLLTFEIDHEKGSEWDEKPDKNIRMLVHNFSTEPSGIVVNDKELPHEQWSWNKENNILIFEIVLQNQASISIHR